MAFQVPQMPLTANIYSYSDGPFGAMRLDTICNLAHGRRGHNPTVYGFGGTNLLSAAELLVPALTDIRGIETGGDGPDWVECPAGSGRIYIVIHVDDYGKGFANEHRFAVMTYTESFPWPVPIP